MNLKDYNHISLKTYSYNPISLDSLNPMFYKKFNFEKNLNVFVEVANKKLLKKNKSTKTLKSSKFKLFLKKINIYSKKKKLSFFMFKNKLNLNFISIKKNKKLKIKVEMLEIKKRKKITIKKKITIGEKIKKYSSNHIKFLKFSNFSKKKKKFYSPKNINKISFFFSGKKNLIFFKMFNIFIRNKTLNNRSKRRFKGFFFKKLIFKKKKKRFSIKFYSNNVKKKYLRKRKYSALRFFFTKIKSPASLVKLRFKNKKKLQMNRFFLEPYFFLFLNRYKIIRFLKIKKRIKKYAKKRFVKGKRWKKKFFFFFKFRYSKRFFIKKKNSLKSFFIKNSYKKINKKYLSKYFLFNKFYKTNFSYKRKSFLHFYKNEIKLEKLKIKTKKKNKINFKKNWGLKKNKKFLIKQKKSFKFFSVNKFKKSYYFFLFKKNILVNYNKSNEDSLKSGFNFYKLFLSYIFNNLNKNYYKFCCALNLKTVKNSYETLIKKHKKCLAYDNSFLGFFKFRFLNSKNFFKDFYFFNKSIQFSKLKKFNKLWKKNLIETFTTYPLPRLKRVRPKFPFLRARTRWIFKLFFSYKPTIYLKKKNFFVSRRPVQLKKNVFFFQTFKDLSFIKTVFLYKKFYKTNTIVSTKNHARQNSFFFNKKVFFFKSLSKKKKDFYWIKTNVKTNFLSLAINSKNAINLAPTTLKKKNTFFSFFSKNITNLKKMSTLFTTRSFDINFFFHNPVFFKAYLSTFKNWHKKNNLYSTNLINVNSFYKSNFFLFTNILTSQNFFSFNVDRSLAGFSLFRRISTIVAIIPSETVIKLIEYCTGRKVCLKIDPFVLKSLPQEDTSRCIMWAQRLRVFKRNVGPRLFLVESLQIITLCLRLKDPYVLSNWMLSMFYKMSFWRYKMLFRYMQYILRNYFWPHFKDYKVRGIKFQLKGKVSVAGNARTRTVVTSTGALSHATFKYKILTQLNLLRTFTGVIGFRSWLVF